VMLPPLLIDLILLMRDRFPNMSKNFCP